MPLPRRSRGLRCWYGYVWSTTCPSAGKCQRILSGERNSTLIARDEATTRIPSRRHLSCHSIICPHVASLIWYFAEVEITLGFSKNGPVRLTEVRTSGAEGRSAFHPTTSLEYMTDSNSNLWPESIIYAPLSHTDVQEIGRRVKRYYTGNVKDAEDHLLYAQHLVLATKDP